jgi:hypothetical protein
MTAFSKRFKVGLDDDDSPADVIDALALGPFLEGDEPWSRTVRLQRVRSEAPLLPRGCEPARTAQTPSLTARLARGDGWTLVVRRWPTTAVLVVTARDEATGQAVLDEVTDGACEPPAVEDGIVPFGFWHLASHGPVRNERSVSVAPWASIRRNYAETVASVLDDVVALEPECLAGRLLLLHGPPGTGKTTLLRALASEWRKWCTLELVLDPEQLFGSSGYLMSVVLGDDGTDVSTWRLLVLEDCDELIRADAKAGTGQALARLLNLTDGIIGQGARVLVVITTNEPLACLHPAVVRAGRCLAEVEIGLLSRVECCRWLGRAVAVPDEGMSLAELWALSAQLTVVRNTRSSDIAVGQYL